jgi:hypothetical protein
MIAVRKTTGAQQTMPFTNNLCRASHKKCTANIFFAVRLPQIARQTRAHVHAT